jgi:hypothetical protein
MDKAYTARGQTFDQILAAIERGVIQAKFGADADRYLQTALTAAAVPKNGPPMPKNGGRDGPPLPLGRARQRRSPQ